MKKTVSIVDLTNAGEGPTNHGLLTAEISYKILVQEYPDLKESTGFKETFDSPKVSHLVLFFYKHTNGDDRRRIVGLGNVLNKDEIVKCVKAMMDDVGYTMTRYLELLK